MEPDTATMPDAAITVRHRLAEVVLGSIILTRPRPGRNRYSPTGTSRAFW
jgi:hypothetical protein